MDITKMIREKDVDGFIKDARAVEPLIRALKDEDELVRVQTATALSKIGQPAVEPLIRALKDKDAGVREAAEAALKKIREKKS